MNTKKILLLLASAVTILLSTSYILSQNVQAAGTTYYISPSGDNTNPGTQASPYKTFAYAVAKLKAGDTLIALDGTYKELIKVSGSGTSSAYITIKSKNNRKAIIDFDSGSETPNILLSGSYIIVDGFEVKNADGYGISSTGKYNQIKNNKVHDTDAHGIYTNSQNTVISGNEVYRASLVNAARNMSSGWGSGIKVKVGGNNVTISGNTVYNNYGEGIAVTRGTNSKVNNNIVYNNFGVNIYIDNSYNIEVNSNFSYCTPNSGFERSGKAASAFGMEEEYYSGWGAQLHDVKIVNNISKGCSRGIYFWRSDVSGTGLQNVTIANNTFYNMTSGSIYIETTSTDSNNTIANNIFHQDNKSYGYVESLKNYSVNHNLFNTKPAADSKLAGVGDVYAAAGFKTTPTTSSASFKLASTSPAINTGTKIAAVSKDYYGTARPKGSAYEIGAYEYVETTSTGTTTKTPTKTPAKTSTSTPQPGPATPVSPSQPPTNTSGTITNGNKSNYETLKLNIKGAEKLYALKFNSFCGAVNDKNTIACDLMPIKERNRIINTFAYIFSGFIVITN